MQRLTNEMHWGGTPTALALGTFDGVHLGHQALMQRIVQLARQGELSSLAFTFSTHPMSVFAPDRVPPALQTLEEKEQTIAACGVDAVVLRPFDRDFARMSPESFVAHMVDALHPKDVVIGYNYSFGHLGSGHAQDMEQLGNRYGFRTHIVPPVEVDGEAVSSTRIRTALQAGEVDLAARMLGRAYQLSGTVLHGKQIGRILNYPTANLAWPCEKLLPRCGVYACTAETEQGSYYAAVNIGHHPTVPGGDPTIEAFLLDYPGTPLYQQNLTLRFVRFIRPERTFDSLEALRGEIERNCGQIRQILSEQVPAEKRISI